MVPRIVASQDQPTWHIIKAMEIVKAIILGLVQGLTEFIPVSSSGHLLLAGRLLNFSGSGLLFDTALDIGTLVALFVYFWKDFVELAVDLINKGPKAKLAWFLIIATIPGVIAGILLQHAAETTFRSPQLVGMNLIVVAIIMWAADRYGSKNKHIDDITGTQAVSIGVAQAAALVPGVSRSGITMSAGLASGLDRVSATRFSFLLSAPIITGATAKVLISPSKWGMISHMAPEFIVGILAAGISGYWAIKFMLHYLSKHSLAPFVAYRIVAGILIVWLVK
jgi:undecaprenyl-diphosphatase